MFFANDAAQRTVPRLNCEKHSRIKSHPGISGVYISSPVLRDYGQPTLLLFRLKAFSFSFSIQA